MNETLAVTETQDQRRRRLKSEWQRRNRNEFKAQFGYSQSIHYRFAGNRHEALIRDGFKCVRCGMTDEEHKAKWARPITVDHKDKNQQNNDLSNLQTLCLRCHGQKDILKRLVERQCEKKKDEIMAMRRAGMAYGDIATATGFSIASIWKWVRRRNAESNN